MTHYETTQEDVRDALKDAVQELREEFNAETPREDVLDRVFECVDSMFGDLVKSGMISDYTVDDMVRTASACSAIIQVAEEDAWIADDSGLWEGLTFGVLAAVAFHSLENCLYQALADAGYDTNDDFPFAESE